VSTNSLHYGGVKQSKYILSPKYKSEGVIDSGNGGGWSGEKKWKMR